MAWLHKAEPMKRVKARREREEAKVKKANRAKCAVRDGYCRLQGTPLGPCSGPSEWNHVEKRSLTMRQPPEVRHSTRVTMMNCRAHHQRIDGKIGGRRIRVCRLTEDGCDGRLAYEWDGNRYEEPER